MSSNYEITLDDTKYKVSVERLDEGGILIVKVGDDCFTIKTQQTDEGLFVVNDTINDFAIKLVKKTRA